MGATAKDNKKFVDAVLWILRSGSSWRSLLEHCGDWPHVHRRFFHRARAGEIAISPRSNRRERGDCDKEVHKERNRRKP